MSLLINEGIVHIFAAYDPSIMNHVRWHLLFSNELTTVGPLMISISWYNQFGTRWSVLFDILIGVIFSELQWWRLKISEVIAFDSIAILRWCHSSTSLSSLLSLILFVRRHNFRWYTKSLKVHFVLEFFHQCSQPLFTNLLLINCWLWGVLNLSWIMM